MKKKGSRGNSGRDGFFMEDYQHKAPFSSFLPGIAGRMGIPAWVYYNNRGQGVCSFGVQDRDHAILEFCPAHMAYQNNARTGFRTFLKVNGQFQEAFRGRCDMHILAGELEISWQSDQLKTSALYFGVPGERAGMLARILTVQNTSDAAVQVDLLDGLPAVVPYGVSNESLKMMTQLSKAWMQVENPDSGTPCFCVRASMADTAQVTKVRGGNFAFGMDENGRRLPVIVQPELIFGEDTALERPDGYLTKTSEELCRMHQVTENEFPCCFFAASRTLMPGDSMQILSLFGQTGEKSEIEALTAPVNTPEWFMEKRRQAEELVRNLTDVIDTKTANEVFDGYCRQTYLDNLLRGGTPVFFGKDDRKMPFYMYSRKHGDPEREYNAFSLGDEYYAQGNGNFRDVCQNRRCDVFFHPQLKDFGIRTFFELIQSDGYNPLVMTFSTFRMQPKDAKDCSMKLPKKDRENAVTLLTEEFTPGRLAMFAQDCGLEEEENREFMDLCLGKAQCDPNADFGEGYWSDHWTYLQDLIDQYLELYPEEKKSLLFAEENLRWYETRAFVNPRRKRYEKTENGLRQYHALDMNRKHTSGVRWMQTVSGETACSSLAEKMVVLCTLKAATADAAGMGIEMEGGKPGWYDALNGLPGLLGSSMAETCELVRTLGFLEEALRQEDGSISLYEEMAELLYAVRAAYQESGSAFERWDVANTAKECYREQTLRGVSGRKVSISCREAAETMQLFRKALEKGIEKAVRIGRGICPTYFAYAAENVTENAQGLMPGELTCEPFPLFLEGPVHWLKLSHEIQDKENMVQKIRESGLYDRKLHMYKVNESLAGVTYEAGRALAFTPGWLENESVWLHMEYKYLLELLRSGLYAQFAEAFHQAAVPFMDPAVYGRSTLENVSFIASSANPDPGVHGRGFVARLSGSTAEFTEIWKLMFFGKDSFFCDENGALRIRFTPFIPAFLIPETKEVSAVFLGRTQVIYHADFEGDILPDTYTCREYRLTDVEGQETVYTEELLPSEIALQIRQGRFRRIHVELSESAIRAL